MVPVDHVDRIGCAAGNRRMVSPDPASPSDLALAHGGLSMNWCCSVGLELRQIRGPHCGALAWRDRWRRSHAR